MTDAWFRLEVSTNSTPFARHCSTVAHWVFPNLYTFICVLEYWLNSMLSLFLWIIGKLKVTESVETGIFFFTKSQFKSFTKKCKLWIIKLSIAMRAHIMHILLHDMVTMFIRLFIHLYYFEIYLRTWGWKTIEGYRTRRSFRTMSARQFNVHFRNSKNLHSLANKYLIHWNPI